MAARLDARCRVDRFETKAEPEIADVTDSSTTACLNSKCRVGWSFISLALVACSVI
jgi:hypothetical protein